MKMIRGAAIRARREALGISLEDLAASTRIPVNHLEAIEQDDIDALPSGPYATAYVRAVCTELGLDDPVELYDDEAFEPLAVTPPQGAPLWLVRALAGLSLLALVGLIASLLLERLGPSLPPIPSRIPDQRLVVVAQRPTRLRVEVDGAVVLDRKVEREERLEFDAADRVALQVDATSRVRIEWNGVAIVPQGRQDAPRELVFVDDRGLGW